MLSHTERQMRVRFPVDAEDMRIFEKRLIAARGWPEERDRFPFPKLCSRNGYVFHRGSAHVPEGRCPSDHFLNCKWYPVPVLDELANEMRLVDQLKQANAHNVARRLDPTEQDQRSMNNKLFKVETVTLILCIGKNRDEVVFRLARLLWRQEGLGALA